MSIISIFDTTVGSYNLGNDIIMEAVRLELNELFPNSYFYKLPPMDINKYTRSCIRKSEFTFFGGTNSLNNNMRKYKQWDLRLRNTWGVKDVILMGLGWWQYEMKSVTNYTKYILNKSLSKDYLHSVRDNYTKEKLESIGINSINTGCPTLWRISENIVNKIPKVKNKSVIFTITDYNKNEKRDKFIIETCLNHYKKVYCFPQGIGDINYITKLGLNNKIEFIKPNLQIFDEILKTGEFDYIGTRLHAGIKAIQNSVYTIIIGIDNRAIEMGKDIGLPVISEDSIENLDSLILKRNPIEIIVPHKSINEWKSQFN